MSATLHTRDAALMVPAYRRLPLDIVRGEGVELITRDGERYLDMFAGLAVNALGYAHPRILAAVMEQAARFTHLSNFYPQEPQVALAELLTGHTGLPRVFFANSGTETTEGAIKLARRRGAAGGRHGLIAFEGGFHGRTYGALSLMNRGKYREGFGPFLPGCTVIPADDREALLSAAGPETAGVILEAIRGEGGIRPLSPEIAGTLARLQKEKGILLIADEVQSGLGRTGRFSAYEHFGLHPDIVTMAKPIGGGLPLGAILTTEDVAAAISPGAHGTTFGGNPVACAAGVATVRVMEEQDLVGAAARLGTHLKEELEELRREFPGIIREVRGFGLMLGVELDRPGDDIVTAMREERVLINCTAGSVLRLLPPLIIREEHIARTCSALRKVLRRV